MAWSRPRLAAWTLSALVSMDGMSWLRKTSMLGTYAGVLDRGDRPDASDHGRGGLGQFGRLAKERLAVLDGEHVGAELVDLGEETRLEEDEDKPSTATMAATPMAIPSADMPARSLRVRKPTEASRPRSAGGSFRRVMTGVAVITCAGGICSRMTDQGALSSDAGPWDVAVGVSETIRPSSISTRRGMRSAMCLVVSDDDEW